jgi:hypothetical protein
MALVVEQSFEFEVGRKTINQKGLYEKHGMEYISGESRSIQLLIQFPLHLMEKSRFLGY